jgi:hypothetical protein
MSVLVMANGIEIVSKTTTAQESGRKMQSRAHIHCRRSYKMPRGDSRVATWKWKRHANESNESFRISLQHTRL